MGTITCELESSYAATAGVGAGDAKVQLHGKLGVPHVRSWFALAGNGTYNGMFVLRRRTNVVGGGMRMQVFVRTVVGKSLALDVSPSDTVAAVKARIQAKERVAAADQRLVYAGRDLDDARRTLAEYGVRKEANLFLHLRLRGGAVGDDVGAADAGGTRCWAWATAVGALATVVAVGSALAYFPAAAAAAGTGGLTLAFLLLMWALAVAGVNLITAGVCLPSRAQTLCRAVQSAMLSKASAFLRQNLSVIGVAAASLAATGVIVGVEDRALCFITFALFLVAMSLVTIGVASCAR